MHPGLLRALILANVLLGFYYLSWRYTSSINWAYWPLALALIAAETYSYIDSWFFGLTMWRLNKRPAPPPPDPSATVDVFITCYNEPVELVRETARAAIAMTFPHRTYILDDGSSAAMAAMAAEEGAGYIVRSHEWVGKGRHAKAGNLNNALFQTSGEFVVIFDADQIPDPNFLDEVLGYFRDPKVAFVQTPQWFYNVPPGDPFGSQAPLFYGPIQQGKDGWNAAFFCGSNAVLRREALMQIGLVDYSRQLSRRVRWALAAADRMLAEGEQQLAAGASQARSALADLRAAVGDARREIKAGASIQSVTWTFQQRANEVSRTLVSDDLALIRSELAAIPGLADLDVDDALATALDDEESLRTLSSRAASPLAAIETVSQLLLAVDVDRADEAIPVMPMSTVSVTEDMATAMRLHANGWTSVYHDHVLARGLAPEDLRTALQQRLRWAQGTIQVMLRENPLLVRGLSLGQRLMYFMTMWSYLSGFFALVYLAAPILYLYFGWIPVQAFSVDFFVHLVPYLIVNQVLFLVIGWGRPTWRGQQYSFALFPIWIKAVTSAVANVYFGRKLGFVVTPKTRQAGAAFDLIRPQLVAMALLLSASIYGLTRIALGLTDDPVPILINVLWACYDIVALSAMLDAATYRPAEEAEVSVPAAALSTSLAHGRAGAGHA